MRIGTRIVRPDDVKRWDAEIYQISIYRGWIDDIGLVKKCVRSCIEKRASFVMHPVGFPLLDHDSFGMLAEIAGMGAEKMILHDERGQDGKRITGNEVDLFGEAVSNLESSVALSFENATETHDVLWFWKHFADSITLDIGHVEAAGMNSVEYVQDLDQNVIRRIEYVHIHHNGGFRNGLTDHHPLHSGCRELEALEALLERNDDVAVILEINETDMIHDSLRLLKDLRNRIKG